MAEEFPRTNPLLFLAKACIIPKDMPSDETTKEKELIHTLKSNKFINLGFKKE